MSASDLLKDLTREKSLFELWRLTRAIASPRRLYYRAVVAASFLLTTASAYLSTASIVDLGAVVRGVATAVALGYAAAIFGVILAGFAIFATIGTSDLAPRLALVPRTMGDKTVSELKFMALHFIKAFVPFLGFFAFSFAIAFLGLYGGPATLLANALGATAARMLAAVTFGALAGFVAHLLLVLGSLTYNVYMALMTMVRVRLDPNVTALVDESIEELKKEADAATAPQATGRDASTGHPQPQPRVEPSAAPPEHERLGEEDDEDSAGAERRHR